MDEPDEPMRGADGGVVVPMRLYKTVTVFSTLIAVAMVVAGFIILDAATNGATASPSDVNVVLAVLGVGVIGGGAAVYAFASRFSAPEAPADTE